MNTFDRRLHEIVISLSRWVAGQYDYLGQYQKARNIRDATNAFEAEAVPQLKHPE